MKNLFLIALCPLQCLLALEDTTNRGFFNRLEQELRADYIACTGDSALVPVKEMIRWKHWVDSMTSLPDFPAAQKAYTAETGNSAVKDRPCVVLRWKLAKDSVARMVAAETAAQKRTQSEATAESLAVVAELANLKDRPDFFGTIPLGASRRVFFWRAARAGFGPFTDKGSYLICSKVPLCDRAWLGAFYFDTLGLCRIELEGMPRTVDSLEKVVWAEVALLTSWFEQRIGARPLQINRISRDEINEGELAIARAWSQAAWSVAVGLSRYGYRYYAKAIVSNRPLPRQ